MKPSTVRSGRSGLDRLEAEILRRAWECSPSVLVVTDPSGNIEYVNPAFERVTGYAAGEILGKNPRILKSGNQGPEVYADLWRTISAGGTWTGRIQNRCKDGTLYWESATIFPVLGRRKKILHYIAVKENVTAEEVLQQENERRYALTLEAVDDAVWDWNLATGGAFFSPKYYSMLGYDVGEFPATYESWRSLVHPEDLARVEGELLRHIESGKGYGADIRMRSKSGEWIWILARGSIVEHDAQGKALRMLGTHTDITWRKRAEEALRNETLRRQALEQEVLAIAEGEQRRIGHDLHDGICQELSGIQYEAEHVAMRLPETLPEKALLAKTVEDIRKAILHARHLSHSLSPVVLEKGDLATALAELAANTETTFDIDCAFSCPTPPEISSPITATHLYRITQEAIQNAIRHGAATSIKIALLPSGPGWLLQVADNGTPSALEKQSGRGLQIMAYRASMIGGSLQFQQNAGTTMTCTFSQ